MFLLLCFKTDQQFYAKVWAPPVQGHILLMFIVSKKRTNHHHKILHLEDLGFVNKLRLHEVVIETHPIIAV